jgi:nucleoside-diphosphate-sugar epimerase
VQILVTGAHGFIGAKLLPRLRDRQAAVIAYEGRLSELATFPARCDIVIHLAARAGREDTPSSNLETMRTNVLGTLAVAEYARRFSCGVVFTSTCAVYAAGAGGLRLKEDSPLAPRGPNGLSKLLAEEILVSSSRIHGFPAIVLRLFNVYGPGQPRGYLVADVLQAIAAGEPIHFRNPGAVLDWVHVDDVCEAICRAAETMLGSGVRFFNIGTGKGTRALDVARALVRLAGTGQEWNDPEASTDAPFVVADPSDAERALAWKAAVDLETGLAATLAAAKRSP